MVSNQPIDQSGHQITEETVVRQAPQRLCVTVEARLLNIIDLRTDRCKAFANHR